MAWPPPVLPINRTNALPQLDTHPADHNAVNLAMNDTVAQVLALGNPWRAGDVVNAIMPASALGGALQDVPLTGVVGNLAVYDTSTGHPGLMFPRGGVIVGTLEVAFIAPGADGGVWVDTIYSGLYTALNQLPMNANVPGGFSIPIISNLPAGSVIYWQMAGLLTAQSFAGGMLRIWEAGPFGNNTRNRDAETKPA